MTAAKRKPIDGAYRTWSDGRCVHLLVSLTGGHLGRNPVTMHAKTELAPARAAVRRHFVAGGDTELAGDPVATEALATRVGLFSAFRRIGRAAKGAAALATAPVRALGGAGVNVLKTTGNLAKGIESSTALTEYVTRPLAWRPGRKKRGGPGPAAPPPEQATDQDTPPDQEEEPMSDETSGSPQPQKSQVSKASALLRRAGSNPKSARHVKNIAKAAATGHPGAQLAQAAIAEARRQQSKPPVAAPPARAVRFVAFSSWGRGAA